MRGPSRWWPSSAPHNNPRRGHQFHPSRAPAATNGTLRPDHGRAGGRNYPRCSINIPETDDVPLGNLVPRRERRNFQLTALVLQDMETPV